MDEHKARVRLLWDHGGLWSLMTWEACRDQGLAVLPITCAEIAKGGLEKAKLLIAPGGWPSLKKKALGNAGAAAIRDFVAGGGSYLGFCGGAGLALNVSDGLGLVDLQRVPKDVRLAGASGPIRVGLGDSGHPMWQGLNPPYSFLVWFPAQFAWPDNPGIDVLATYGGPAPGFCSADLEVGSIAESDWPGLEARYGINLNPSHIQGWPAVISARLGKGRLILSHLHFDTPNDPAGGVVLKNLFSLLAGEEPGPGYWGPPSPHTARPKSPGGELAQLAWGLWEMGHGLGLWEPRSPVMPLWKRGSRGLEFWSLYRLSRAVDWGCSLLGDRSNRELHSAMGLVREQGPEVLEAQADVLSGHRIMGRPAEALERWFGVPRRCSGELAAALGLLEQNLLSILNESA